MRLHQLKTWGGLVLALFVMSLVVICGDMAFKKAWGAELALGDSLALGFGRASHMPTLAVVGRASCGVHYKRRGHWRYRKGILDVTPTKHYAFVLLSAGTNDPPGACIEAIRDRLNADRVLWVLPVNGARQHVLSVAQARGDLTLSYTPGRGRVWPHPARYFNVKHGRRS